MMIWLIRIALIVVSIAMVILTITALPTLADQHMAGNRLIMHMMAGGGLVVALPLFGLLFLGRAIDPKRSAGLQRFGFWLLILSTLVSISTVLLCMLPLLSTEQMESSMTFHGYAGFASVSALLVLLTGGVRWRRMQLTRSATPG